MPRHPRVEFDGAIYHVFARGNRGWPIYRARADSRVFLAIASLIVDRYGWICHSFCLMTTHYHLLVATPKANLAAGMHRLNSRYAHWFNEWYGERGHVFDDRYGAVLIEGEAQLLEAYRYIALNPVRAGLCTSPRDWPWSSYALLMQDRSVAPASSESVIEHFGPGPAGREALRRFVELGG